MIYATYKRAKQVADMLNRRLGYARSEPLLVSQGWAVLTSYAFGRSGKV